MGTQVRDASFFYDLLLSIGESYDADVCCRNFTQALNNSIDFNYLSIWITSTNQHDIFRSSVLVRYFQNPEYGEVFHKELNLSQVTSSFKENFFLAFDNVSILSEHINSGKVIIFKLGAFGFLEIQGDHLRVSDFERLEEFRVILEKFTHSLKSCFHYEQLITEKEERSRAEKKIKNMALFPDENPNPIFRVSNQGRLLYANKASLMIMGHLKLKIGKKVPLSVIQSLRKSYSSSKREFVLYVNYRYYSFLTIKIKKRKYFNLYGTNVTLLKEGEKKLRKSERRYRELVEFANDIICQTDSLGKITYINPIGKSILKVESEDIIGKNFFQLVHPSHKQEVRKFYKKQVKDGTISSFLQFRALDMKGNFLWIEQKVQPLFTDGKLKGFSAIARDVTARVVGDELLKQSEEKLRLVIDNAFDGIITIDKEHVITEWNPRAKAIFGYNVKNAIGKDFTKMLSEDETLEEYKESILEFVKTANPKVLNKRYEFNGIKKSGDTFPLELTISPLKINKEFFFSIFLRDITIERQSKIELERSLVKERELGEMKSRFVSMTSHEFRTPLTTIRSSVELLSFFVESQEVKFRDKILKNLSRINNEISRLTRLMNDILTIGRLDASRMTYSPSLVDITSITREIIKFNFSQNEGLVLNVVGKPKKLNLDENVFTHVLTNLMSNAIKYSPNARPPEVTIHFDKKCTNISIKDFGIGIPEKDQKNLFTSFYRASNVGNIQGTGLGLSIVKQFVEMMGGEIKLNSKLNHGTEFMVKLFC